MARQGTSTRARKRAVAHTPETADETAPENWLRNIRFSGFTILMLGLLILAVIVLAPNLRIFIEQRQAIAALEQQVAQTEQAVDDLTEDVARWEDPAYIESQARERLFYVYPGDISYLVVGSADTTTTSEGLPISNEIQTTQVDWVRSLLSSIYTAGLTTAPADELAVVP